MESTLKALLEYLLPVSNNNIVKAIVRQAIAWELPHATDKNDNITIGIPHENKIMLVAHHDTVNSDDETPKVQVTENKDHIFTFSRGIIKDEVTPPKTDELTFANGTRWPAHKYAGFTSMRGCLGGDDRVGCAIALALTQAYPDQFYCAIFSDEESGGTGSEKYNWLVEANAVIGIDRRGSKDIAVTIGSTNLATEEFADILKAAFPERTTCSGMFTDVVNLAEKTKRPMCNLSCGYHSPHSVDETISLNEVVDTASGIIAVSEALKSHSRLLDIEQRVNSSYVRYSGTFDRSDYFDRYHDADFATDYNDKDICTRNVNYATRWPIAELRAKEEYLGTIGNQIMPSFDDALRLVPLSVRKAAYKIRNYCIDAHCEIADMIQEFIFE